MGRSESEMMEDQEQLSAPTESAQAEAPAPSNAPQESQNDDVGTDETGLLGQVESDDEEIEAAGEKYRVPKKLSAHLKELEQGSLRQDD
jgi:hypothetical protein